VCLTRAGATCSHLTTSALQLYYIGHSNPDISGVQGKALQPVACLLSYQYGSPTAYKNVRSLQPVHSAVLGFACADTHQRIQPLARTCASICLSSGTPQCLAARCRLLCCSSDCPARQSSSLAHPIHAALWRGGTRKPRISPAFADTPRSRRPARRSRRRPPPTAGATWCG